MTAVIGLLVAPSLGHADDTALGAPRFSIGGTVAPVEAPTLTLLEPSWLLPPIEALDTPVPESERTEELLRDDGSPSTATAAHPSTSDQVGYSLSDDLTAKLAYHHSELNDRADSQSLRDDQWSAFSTIPNRDVVDLGMSWHLAGNTVGVGYQFEAARSGAPIGYSGLSRFLPGNPQATHSFTVGLTRRWGAESPPALLEPVPVLVPDLAAASSQDTPTPVP
jgi:hypothetical protein